MNRLFAFFIFCVFMTFDAWALYTDILTNQCGVVLNNMYANFVPNTYTCESGEFLPANTLGCKPCPNDYRCPGGIYDFNENRFQGAEKSTTYITHDLTNMCAKKSDHFYVGVFTPNVHTCAVGEYLPANVDGCMPCLENNYCPGGMYVFNETQNQGLVSCPELHPFAPGGMWLESQCGRKMHVGDDVLYLHSAPAAPTVKRLYVRFNNAVYSANATEKEFAPATMSERATRALHVLIDGVEYLIHDDSAR